MLCKKKKISGSLSRKSTPLQSSFLLNDPSNAIGICNLDYKNGLLGASASGDATGLPLLPTYKPQAGKKTFLSTIPLDIDCKGHLQA